MDRFLKSGDFVMDNCGNICFLREKETPQAKVCGVCLFFQNCKRWTLPLKNSENVVEGIVLGLLLLLAVLIHLQHGALKEALGAAPGSSGATSTILTSPPQSSYSFLKASKSGSLR